MDKPKKIPPKDSPKVRKCAVRLVFDQVREHPSQWAAISLRYANDRQRPDKRLAHGL